MLEPLTRPLVAQLLTRLEAAYPRTLSKQNPAYTAEVYYEGLCGLSGAALRFAVHRAIQEDVYFPKVARLRELATEWQRRNTPKVPRPIEEDGMICPVCRRPAEQHQVTRKSHRLEKTQGGREHYVEVLDERGQPTWETIISPRSEIFHDRELHGIHDPEVREF